MMCRMERTMTMMRRGRRIDCRRASPSRCLRLDRGGSALRAERKIRSDMRCSRCGMAKGVLHGKTKTTTCSFQEDVHRGQASVERGSLAYSILRPKAIECHSVVALWDGQSHCHQSRNSSSVPRGCLDGLRYQPTPITHTTKPSQNSLSLASNLSNLEALGS